ncbi:FAD-dependent oxidoreductase [Actinomadura rubrisoli]|uniref:FAD-dependent oxidoreductase n=1 Tax=Actinomadura rubrisoli TaxID=2530368 RepID=A0A4R5AKX9_9ACTN|nr:FAD-dependent oxidoreductase [Actinomadura rubrisoli]TDD72505.1 FAD-dependent oxidoreductase [Actinomadura rubrisoli]
MKNGRAAVIGGGISGLAAAYALRRSHHVTLFEAQKRIGGNANTVTIAPDTEHPSTLGIDTGVVIFCGSAMPPLFDELGITRIPVSTDLTYLTIRCAGCGLDTAELDNGLPRRPHISDGAWRHFIEGYQRLRGLVAEGDIALRPADLVTTEGFSEYFVEHMIIPLIAGAYVIPPAAARHCSVTAILRALANVGIQLGDSMRDYCTVKGGTRTYIDRLAAAVPDLRVGTAIEEVGRMGDGVTLRDSTGAVHDFDKAVIAVQADRALSMLASPTALQHEVLGAFPYAYSSWALHTDTSVGTSDAIVHYQMADCGNAAADLILPHNGVQKIPGPVQYLSTCGGTPPAPTNVLQTATHGIAVITPQAVAAQQKLPQISDSVLAFAGAYFGDTAHENALCSGLNAASILLGGRSSGGLRDMRTGIHTAWSDQT